MDSLSQIPDKIYFNIGEVAKILDVKPSKIRYWESQFKEFINPIRNRHKNRIFTKKDIELLFLIKYLADEVGLKLNGIKNYLRLHKKELSERAKMIEKLTKVKEFLEELKATLD